MKALCIDIGGTALKSGLFINDELTECNETPCEGSKGVDNLFDTLFGIIDGSSDYDIIAIDTAGQINSNTGTVVGGCGNIPGYEGTIVADVIGKKYNKKVIVENDVNAAAIGEHYYGAAKGLDNFLCLTYGTGVGGAIYIDGKLYKGNTMSAGEFGHMCTHPGGVHCNCGLNGCYEQYASTTALVKKASAYDSTLTDGRKVFKAYYSDNPKVKKIVYDWTDEIVYGLSSLTHIFNPAGIILGGGIFNESCLVEIVKEKLYKHIMPSFGNMKIVRAALGNKAGMYGMLHEAKIAMKSN